VAWFVRLCISEGRILLPLLTILRIDVIDVARFISIVYYIFNYFVYVDGLIHGN